MALGRPIRRGTQRDDPCPPSLGARRGTGSAVGAASFKLGLSIGRLPGERAEYGTRSTPVSTLSKVPCDGGQVGPGQAGQVGRGHLELETASTSRHEYGRVRRGAGI